MSLLDRFMLMFFFLIGAGTTTFAGIILLDLDVPPLVAFWICITFMFFNGGSWYIVGQRLQMAEAQDLKQLNEES